MHHDEKDGYVLSIVVGALDEPGDWLLGFLPFPDRGIGSERLIHAG